MQRIAPYLLGGLLALNASRATASTYYVSANGADSNTGTQAQPWRSVGNAAKKVAAGDTVLVQPGVYDEYVSFSIGGTTNNPITIRANGAVTNLGSWKIYAPSIVIDGFEFTGRGTNADSYATMIALDKEGCTNVWIINNKFHDRKTTSGPYLDFGAAEAYGYVGSHITACVVSNNFFWNVAAKSTITVFGDGNLIVNNVVSNTYGGDFIRPFGRNHIIRGNVIKELGQDIFDIAGCSNNDFNGHYYSGAYSYIQTNWLVVASSTRCDKTGTTTDLGKALYCFSRAGFTNGTSYFTNPSSGVYQFYFANALWATNTAWTGTYRYTNSSSTNIMVVTDRQPSYVWTNSHGYLVVYDESGYAAHGWSNRFNIVSADGATVYTYTANQFSDGTWIMNDPLIGSAPTDSAGALDHPDFIQVYGPQVGGAGTWASSYNSTNILIEGNYVQANAIGALGQLVSLSGTNEPPAVHHWTFRNNIFIGLRTVAVSFPYCFFYNNLFYQCGAGGVSAISMSWYNPSGSLQWGESYGGEVRNNAFVDCAEGAANQGWYAMTPDSDYTPLAGRSIGVTVTNGVDYNYVCISTNTWAGANPGTYPGQSWKFYEYHGVNGGDPRFVSLATCNFRLQSNSVFIGKGVLVPGLAVDFDGNPRPRGAPPAIGPFEYTGADGGSSRPLAPRAPRAVEMQ